MTTVIWDGKEMAADTRASFMNTELTQFRYQVNDYLVKLYVPMCLDIDGEAIEVMGFAGVAALGEYLCAYDWEAGPHQRDLALTQDFFSSAHPWLTMESELLIVTATKVHVVAMKREGDKTLYRTESHPRHHWVMIGSGARAVAQVDLQNPGMQAMLQKKSAREAIQRVTCVDLATGGTYCVWNEVSGIEVEILMDEKYQEAQAILTHAYDFKSGEMDQAFVASAMMALMQKYPAAHAAV